MLRLIDWMFHYINIVYKYGNCNDCTTHKWTGLTSKLFSKLLNNTIWMHLINLLTLLVKSWWHTKSRSWRGSSWITTWWREASSGGWRIATSSAWWISAPSRRGISLSFERYHVHFHNAIVENIPSVVDIRCLEGNLGKTCLLLSRPFLASRTRDT